MKTLKVGGDYEELSLQNGLTVWVIRDTTQPLARGTVVVRAGAKDSPNSGIAHYFEHMMFKGTTTIGTTDYSSEKTLLDKIVDQYALLGKARTQTERDLIQQTINRLNIEASAYAIPNDFSNLIRKYGGTELNAGTSYDYTTYYNSFQPEYLAHWCALYSERLVAPVFRLFQSELETVYEEKNMQSNNPVTSATQHLFDRVFAPHPYQFPIIGSTEALKTPDLNAMQQFFDTYYTAGSMAVILSGDLPEKSQLLPLLEETFGRVKPGKPSRPTYGPPARFEGQEVFEIMYPTPSLNVVGTFWHTVPNNHPDQLPLQLIGALLNNSGKTGLLDKMVLRQKATSATSTCFSLNDCGFFGIMAIPKDGTSSGQQVQSELKQAIKQVKEGTFSDELFSQAKLALLRHQYEIFENPKARQTYFQNLFASYSTLKETEQELDRLEKMTKSELTDIANKYFGQDQLQVTKTLGRYPNTSLPKPPYTPVTGTSANVTSLFAKQLQTLPYRQREIRTLNLNQDKDTLALSERPRTTLYYTHCPYNDLFQLTLIYHRSEYTHPILDLLASYLEQVGGAGLEAATFYDRLYQYGATLSFSTDDLSFTIELKGSDKYFCESMDLLSGYLRAPEENKDALKEVRHEILLADEISKTTPETLCDWLTSYIRFGTKAGYRQALSPDEANKITLQDLQKELKELLATEVDIHYSGSLSQTVVAKVISQMLPPPQATPKPAEPPIYLDAQPIAVPSIYTFHDSDATQAVIRSYLSLGHLSPKDLRQATLFSHYLGGGMGSVLFQETREYRSLTYYVWCTLVRPQPVDSAHTAHLLIGMSTQHDKVAEAIQLLTNILNDLPLTIERFQNAQNDIRSNVGRLYPTLRKKSTRIASLLRAGYKDDYAKELLDISEQSSLKDLSAFYNKHIANKPLACAVVGNTQAIDLASLKSSYTHQEISPKDLFKQA